MISEEFGDWEESRRRIDLLCIDRAANLVVIELKRNEDGGHMELQAIRYASMVARMTFDKAIEVYSRYLQENGRPGGDARALLLSFLDSSGVTPAFFAKNVRIVLASADFSRELTSSVLWLNEHDVDIQCVRLTPYMVGERLLVEVQRIIPLPGMGQYQVQLREKAREERETRPTVIDFTRFDVHIGDENYPDLTKRHAILRIFRYLSERGIGPEEIATLVPRGQQRVMCTLDGDFDSAEFRARASARAQADGAGFDARRWFCDDGELVHVNGKTYAFSNQWGGDKWRETMQRLGATYSQFNIRFAETS